MKPQIAIAGLCFGLAAAGVAAPLTTAASDTARILWRDPGVVSARNVFWGAGSAARVPKAPFTFVTEDTSGTKPKIDITDAAGVKWSVKLPGDDPAGNEVHAEIAATRLVWALGYLVDENYFVPDGRIEGVKDLKRAASMVGADGSFRRARFERRPAGALSRGEWHLEKDNPFMGTRELSGLQMLAMLLGNWDVPPHNSLILRVPAAGGGAEERYLISDWGSTFGRIQGGLDRSVSRWNLKDYVESRLVSGVVRDRLEFRYPLLGNAPLAIPVDHARWFMAMASQLTDRQIRQAFQAAGATATDIDGFSAAVSRRIAELNTALK